MALQYDPTSTSTIDGAGSDQVHTRFWLRKSLIEAYNDMYFTQLAPVEDMPKHYGKRMDLYLYVPLLDDRNVNDQGIDANGATTAYGNLYGSSKDTGTIQGRLPVLGENGGRVNRVGFTRLMRTGEIKKFGMFYEWTRESMAFDTDAELDSHLARELTAGAVKIYEDTLQAELLTSAGVQLFAGAATSVATVSGEGAGAAIIDYDLFVRMHQVLTENKVPMKTKIVSGSKNIDTRVINGARIAYVGPELVPHLKRMTDSFGNKAFIEVQHYADASKPLNGEIGTIDQFRIIQVQDMQHWAGGGATVSANPGYRATSGKYDVFPILFVGDDSFATLGFQADAKTGGMKFTVISKPPGRETADRTDPFGETGFTSMRWYYGTIIKRPERIAIMYGVAPI